MIPSIDESGGCSAARRTSVAVKANGMDFIDESVRAILVGKIANGMHVGDGAAHRIDRFKGDDLRR